MAKWERELETATEAARRAGALALSYQAGIGVEQKHDLSPVTRADRECEALIAGMLLEAFPEDGLLGEEGAKVEARSGGRWIVDPIDGTRDYVRGTPLWSTLIGLEQDGEVVAGVLSLPALGNMYIASRGNGAYRDGVRIHASAKTSIGEAVLCINGLNHLRQTPFRHKLLDWMEPFWSVRSLGGAPDVTMVASGRAEIWIETQGAAWDLAPLIVLIEEAGGVFLNFDGGRSIYGRNCVACAPAYEPEVRRLLGLPDKQS